MFCGVLYVTEKEWKMGEPSKGAGRDLPNINKQEFLKECYRKEDHTRLRGYLKNAKYRERQKTGEFKMITVLRDRYLGGVPKPGGYYKRVWPVLSQPFIHSFI